MVSIAAAVIVTSLFAVVHAQANSTDDLEKLLLEAIQNNETYTEVDFGDSKEKPCEPFVTKMPNYTMPGRSISVTKCLEYLWEMENRNKEELWGQRCRLYLISQLNKDVRPVPLINSTAIFDRAATRREFPHMGAIGWRTKSGSPKWIFKCGSALISEKFALAAAHCSKISIPRSSDILNPVAEIIRFGVENTADDGFNINDQPIDVTIKRFIPHPSYKSPKKYNDIALIELDSVVQFKNNLHPACLYPYSDINQLGSEFILTAFGPAKGDKQALQLQTSAVELIESSKCDDILKIYRHRNWNRLQETQMCAATLHGEIDTCENHAGGPLQVKVPLKTEGNMYQILGFTSFGFKCGKKDRPDVYTRVSNFIDWIEDTVWAQNDTALDTGVSTK